MKKVIAAIVLCVLAFIGFFVYQGHEKSIQNDLYEEAAVFFEEEDYKKAIQYFEEAREHDNLFTGSLDEELSYYQAEAYANLGEYEEAIEIYDRMIGENPKEAMNYTLKEYCLYHAGDYEQAAQVYEEGYQQTGEESFLASLANLYVSIEEYEKALAIVKDSDEKNAEDVKKELKFLEIVIYEKQQEYEAAYEKAVAFCEAYPEDEQGIRERDFLESRK